jgi:predicted nucleotide-binding protein (sugar kinase/HSP70/actin superfamily)
MCDRAFVLQAALEAHRIPAEVLSSPVDETLAIGLDLCRGRECLPCFLTTGDIIRRARQPDFDPAQAVFLMPATSGPCRFGQYSALQRDILNREGLAEMEIISPNAENSYQGFGDNPTQLRQLVWQGIVAVDLFQKLLHEYRPYELNRGQADQIYRHCLDRVVTAIREGGGKAVVEAMEWTATRFEDLPVDRTQPRPLIGVVGEIYLRFNTYGNQDIIRLVEAAGGEVVLATMMEWLYFTNWYYKTVSLTLGRYLDFFTTFIADLYQQGQERKLMKPVEHLLKHPHESPMKQLIDSVRPYYDPYLATEAVLSMGKAIEFARTGLCGILHIMPFSCMPGIITAGMASRLRADLNNIPWLDVIYDAQGGTNLKTRLDAFMYQAVQHQRQMANVDFS